MEQITKRNEAVKDSKQTRMFCYQCQETAGNKGCTVSGMCGKVPEVANMQDLLIYVTKGLSAVTTKMREKKLAVDENVNHRVTFNLFTTITNANFDNESIKNRIKDTLLEKERLLKKLNDEDKEKLPEAALWNGDESEFEKKAKEVGIMDTEDDNVRSLRSLITYGIKGIGAYSKHANALLKDNPEIDAFIQKALAATLRDDITVDNLVSLALEVGKNGVAVMQLLDKANTDAYGEPEITKVNIGVRKNPAILVSGHDLRDLEMLLEQTKGTGVDVYTFGDASGMLLSCI